LNTYSDATGVLLFDGPARITPVIEMLFQPFNLGAPSAGADNQRYVNVLSEESDPFWDSYLADIVAKLPEATRRAIPADESAEFILTEIGHHFGVYIEEFVDSVDFEGQVNIVDAIELAEQFRDGHNLIGLSMEGAWHSHSARLRAFGGWAIHRTPRCMVSLDTAEVIHFASTLDEAIGQTPDATQQVLSRWFNRFVDGIADQHLQEALRSRYVLPESEASTLTARPVDWSRSLYVCAISTDDGTAPTWARIQISPALIRQLKELQAVCTLHRLSKTCIAGSPDAWGPTSEWRHVRLVPQHLVVAGDAFWFSAEPKPRICAFETLPLSIHWLMETFTGSGEPVYHGIHFDAVNA
jgi:hypothetical protein